MALKIIEILKTFGSKQLEKIQNFWFMKKVIIFSLMTDDFTQD